MKRLVSIIIIALISLFTASCSITPMRTNTDSNNIENDNKVAASGEKTVTINALVPKLSHLRFYEEQGLVKLPEGIELNLLPISEKNDVTIESDKIIPKLLAHSSEIDIYYVRSDQEFAKSIVDRGYYVDLMKNNKLKAYFDKMYPQIRKWSMSENKAFGFPVLVTPDAHMLINEQALKKLNYSSNSINTFKDLLNFNDTWKKSDFKSQSVKGVYASMKETGPYIIKSYLLSHYDYEKMYEEVDNNEFRDLLKNVKGLYENNGLGDGDAVGFRKNDLYNLPVYMGFSLPLYIYPGPVNCNEEMRPFSVPVVGSEIQDKHSITSSFYIINPYSDNIEAAMEVMVKIAEMSKHYSHSNSAIVWDLLYKDMESYNCDNEGCLYGCSLNKGYDNEEVFTNMGNFYDKYEMYFAFPGMSDILTVCSDYIEGNITLEEAIEKIKEKIYTVQRENAK
jgi:hypothetical protein